MRICLALLLSHTLLSHAQFNATPAVVDENSLLELELEALYDLETLYESEAPHGGLQIRNPAKPKGGPAKPDPKSRAGLTEPRNCGVYTIDCVLGPATCNNACFWHYCLQGYGDNYSYTDGGPEPDPPEPRSPKPDKPKRKSKPTPKANKHRALSGVLVTKSSPCRKMPMVQKLYDDFMNDGNWNTWQGPDLEADEWPQAAMKQAPFVNNAWPPRNSLRCIPQGPNARVGTQYSSWRQAEGFWSKKDGGKYADERTCEGDLREGDTFNVRFNLEGVENPEKVAPYCVPPKPGQQRMCQNDGYQFYMTQYRPANNADPNSASYGKSAGKLTFPPDLAIMNTYKLAGSSGNLGSSFVQVTRSGEEQEKFQVYVRRRYDDTDADGKMSPWHNKLNHLKIVAQGSGVLLNNGDRFDIQPTQTMNQRLTVIRRAGCKVAFLYGDLKNNPLDSFSWNTETKGFNTEFSAWFPENKRNRLTPWVERNRNPAFKNPGAYCEVTGVAADAEEKPWKNMDNQ